MVNWDEVATAESSDELKQAKMWLFQENIRLENERKELAASQERFLNERIRFKRELDELNRRTVQERKRLKEETLFFEKKMAILQAGFRQLEQDRQTFQQQQKREQLEGRRQVYRRTDDVVLSEDAVKRLFAGLNNSLALRKRYRDLVKIFHPDNMFGDEELVQMINKEYLKRREEL